MPAFQAQLDSVIRLWNQTHLTDEWTFQRFRDDAVNSLSSEQAFAEITPTIDRLLRCEREDTAIEVLETLLALTRVSDTTEAPEAIRDRCDAIKGKMEEYSKYARDKLAEWLRHYDE